ncbi:MAG: patatin-like phospholipase family protein [Chloroflexi bacterium]|nr:patatin-like phospholipase family protein [Chloroflexota bacterium]
MNSNSGKKRALVLSGGGGRGAYHIGVLQFLEEHEWWPDVVVGTSIGAVNGAAIASGHTARSLKALWKRLKTDNVQKANLLNPLTLTSILDTSPLRDTLQREGWVDFNRINTPNPAFDLRITATEIATGQLHIFGNSSDARSSAMIQAPITVDHILSSCSIPMVYPATTVGDRTFWDGAILANTPLGAAIDAGATEIIVVVMTPIDGSSKAFAQLPANLLSTIGMMLDWVLLSSFQAEMRAFRFVNKWIKLQDEIDQLQGGNSERSGKIHVDNPLIVYPETFLPVNQIISYTDEGHEKLFKMGYDDAKRAWKQSNRVVEGEG